MTHNPQIAGMLARMTLAQKASLCSGADFWHLEGIESLGIPQIMLTDGPNGLRKQAGSTDHVGLNESVPATCFPSLSALASSWDVELARRIGVALGEECRQEKVAVILGPGLNIKRSALCGRNFEYLSEDPLLAGRMAAAIVQGVQSQGIGTSPKHYAANNQETRRMSIDTVVDARALREIYLAGFETVVTTAQPATLMTAYNRVNGEYCSEHSFLLDHVLRKEWGFKGMTVTDWGGTNDRVKGLVAGQDLEMPSSGGGNDRKIVAAVERGELDVAVLDRTVARILGVVLPATEVLVTDHRYDAAAHHALAREAAAASAVLLKNEGLLPLPAGKTVAVIGRFAQHARYQGSGSAKVKPSRLDTAWDALLASLPPDAVVGYADGYGHNAMAPDPEAIAQARALASRADIVLVFAGLPEKAESEGFDRTNLDMPDSHNALIAAVAGANPATVVVLSNGAPVGMPWLHRVNAVLECYLGGQAWGSAVADLLTGRVSPGGKLAESFPASLDAEPCHSNFPGGTRSVAYAESVYVGYRWYDTAGQAVLFPFGHGLSYSRFEYSDLQIEAPPASAVPGPDTPMRVTVDIRNAGAVQASEVVQLYVHDRVSSVFRPNKELKGFAKARLAPGQSCTLTLWLDRRAFAFWDSGASDWVVESGEFDILVGASSADIRLQATVRLDSGDALSPWAQTLAAQVPEYFRPAAAHFADLSPQGPFARLLGRAPPPRDLDPAAEHTRNATLQDVQTSWVGRVLVWAARRASRKMVSADGDPETLRMMDAILMDLPLRGLGLMSQGKLSERAVDGLVHMINGRWLQGFHHLLTKA